MPDPVPLEEEVLVQVLSCGVCRTDLHIMDGDLPFIRSPMILGHEIIGKVLQKGTKVDKLAVGDRVGIPWLGWTCGDCVYCKTGRENLCDKAQFTGYHINGGYAELTTANQRFCFLLDDFYSDTSAAPLLCAGLIGYRALNMAGSGKNLGIYGFGAAAHIVCQVALNQGKEVFAFTRENDFIAQEFATSLGATWAGSSNTSPPKPLDAAIIFASDGELVPKSLKALSKGSTVVCAGIHMTDIPSFPYSILWGERVIKSVTNLTFKDGLEFLSIAPKIPVKTKITEYPLVRANEALDELRRGKVSGAAVLIPTH